MGKIIISKEEMHDLYVTKELTYEKIACMYGTTKHTIMYWAHKLGIKSRRGGRKSSDIIGQRFGKLVVVCIDKNDGRHKLYTCKCDCGNISSRSSSELLSKGEHKSCWDCRNKFISAKKWGGFGDISGDVFSSIKRHAATRSLEFGVTIEQIWELFLKQNRKCALTGIDLEFGRSKKGSYKKETTASLDRIDSNNGYYIDNVQWVHKEINKIKMDLNEQQFIEWCKLVANYRSS